MALLRREETSHDLYLTEKEFRAYGLRGERRNVSPRIVPPALEALHREYEREHLARQPNLIYGEAVPAHRENVHSDPLYLNDRDYLLILAVLDMSCHLQHLLLPWMHMQGSHVIAPIMILHCRTHTWHPIGERMLCQDLILLVEGERTA